MNNKFKIVIPSYNNNNWVEVNVESILEQSYQNYEVLYIDDCSTDDTRAMVEEMVSANSKWKIVTNKKNMKRGYNISPINPNLINFMTDDEDILVFVDGDDWLANSEVLSNLNNFYNKNDCWMSYGGYVNYPEITIEGHKDQYPSTQNTQYSEEVHSKVLYRKDWWRASHLRTFKWWLYKKIKDEDLRYSKTNKYYFHAEDLATSYPCLEMCGVKKIGVHNFITYLFNNTQSNRERGIEREKLAGDDLELEIRNKSPYSKVHKPFNVNDLFRFNRFDLPIKYMYAKFRENGINSEFGVEIYKEHLRLWNGFKEYNRPEKNTFEAFRDEFDSILDSIKNDGFDGNKSKIVIDSDNLLLNGSHRTVSCALYNKKADFFVGEVYKDGQVDCGYKMFEDMGLDRVYMDASAFELCNINKNMFVVSLFPSAIGNDELVESILNHNGSIAYKKIVKLNNNGSFNLMRQMYYGEEWAGNVHNNYQGFRDKAGLCFTNDNPLRVYLVEFDNVNVAVDVKSKIRDIYKISNHSVHINDTHEETVRLARVLLNQNSIHYMNNAKLQYFQKFENLLQYFKTWISNNNLSIEDYCVTASSVLSIYGLREGDDLDYLHKSKEISGHDVIHSHNEYGVGKYSTEIDDIIYNPKNHFYFNDVKFASLHVVKKLKEFRMEQKDINDLKLIEELL